MESDMEVREREILFQIREARNRLAVAREQERKCEGAKGIRPRLEKVIEDIEGRIELTERELNRLQLTPQQVCERKELLVGSRIQLEKLQEQLERVNLAIVAQREYPSDIEREIVDYKQRLQRLRENAIAEQQKALFESVNQGHLNSVSVGTVEALKELYLSEVELSEAIGDGIQGTVYRGLWQGSTPVAAKAVHRAEDMKQFQEEACLLQRVRHPNIVNFLGMYENDETLYMVMEWCAGGSGESFVRRVERSWQAREVDEATVQRRMVRFSKDVAQGMLYLTKHNPPILHRDLALRNVLCDEHDRCKISDLGMSRMANEYRSTDAIVPYAIAPEALVTAIHNERSEVWSFGLLMIDTFEWGRSPQSHTPFDCRLMKHIVATPSYTGHLPPRPAMCPAAVYDLAIACLHADPLQRPLFPEIFKELQEVADQLAMDGNLESSEASTSAAEAPSAASPVASRGTEPPSSHYGTAMRSGEVGGSVESGLSSSSSGSYRGTMRGGGVSEPARTDHYGTSMAPTEGREQVSGKRGAPEPASSSYGSSMRAADGGTTPSVPHSQPCAYGASMHPADAYSRSTDSQACPQYSQAPAGLGTNDGVSGGSRYSRLPADLGPPPFQSPGATGQQGGSAYSASGGAYGSSMHG